MKESGFYKIAQLTIDELIEKNGNNPGIINPFVAALRVLKPNATIADLKKVVEKHAQVIFGPISFGTYERPKDKQQVIKARAALKNCAVLEFFYERDSDFIQGLKEKYARVRPVDLGAIFNKVENPNYRRVLKDNYREMGGKKSFTDEQINRLIDEINTKVDKAERFDANKYFDIVTEFEGGSFDLLIPVDMYAKLDQPYQKSPVPSPAKELPLAIPAYQNKLRGEIEKYIKAIDAILDKINDPDIKAVLKEMLNDPKKRENLYSFTPPNIEHLRESVQYIVDGINHVKNKAGKISRAEYAGILIDSADKSTTASAVVFHLFSDSKHIFQQVNQHRANTQSKTVDPGSIPSSENTTPSTTPRGPRGD